MQITEWEDSEVHKRLYAIRFGHRSASRREESGRDLGEGTGGYLLYDLGADLGALFSPTARKCKKALLHGTHQDLDRVHSTHQPIPCSVGKAAGSANQDSRRSLFLLGHTDEHMNEQDQKRERYLLRLLSQRWTILLDTLPYLRS